MKSWIHLQKGTTPRQAKVALGELRQEQYGRFGFSGRVAWIYHRDAPAQWLRIEGDLRPRTFDLNKLEPADLSQSRGRPLELLANRDVTMSLSRRAEPMPYFFRNVDGDEVHFVHRGAGTVETEFGPLSFEPGDYLVFPKGCTYRIVPEGADNFLVVYESVEEVQLVDDEWIGRHAPYDPTLLEVPEPVEYASDGRGEYEMVIKRAGEMTSVFYPKHPFDIVGWKGDLFPFRFNIRDYRPVTSAGLHIAPVAWSMFHTRSWLLANLLPIPEMSDPEAEVQSDYHRNIDYDEAAFVHDWDGTGGILMLMPQGIIHGPDEETRAVHAANRRPGGWINWKVISLDTRVPLRRCAALQDQS